MIWSPPTSEPRAHGGCPFPWGSHGNSLLQCHLPLAIDPLALRPAPALPPWGWSLPGMEPRPSNRSAPDGCRRGSGRGLGCSPAGPGAARAQEIQSPRLRSNSDTICTSSEPEPPWLREGPGQSSSKESWAPERPRWWREWSAGIVGMGLEPLACWLSGQSPHLCDLCSLLSHGDILLTSLDG